MNQVPYTGAPSVGPEGRGTSPMHVNTPPEAFGAASAKALTHVGDKLSQVSNELFERAVALQTLDESARANEGTSNYAQLLGERLTTLRSKEGKAAVDDYKTFVQDITQMRENIRSTLDTPMAQKMFDNETRRMHSATVVSAGAHTGQELKKFNNQTTQARIESNKEMAAFDPYNEKNFNANLAANIKAAQTLMADRGHDPDSTASELYVRQTVHDMWDTRIRSVASKEPFKAEKLLQKAIDSDALMGDKISDLVNYVHRQQIQVGSRNIARDIMSGDDQRWGDKVIPGERAVSVLFGNADKRNYTNVITSASGEKLLGAYQIKASELKSSLEKAGLNPMTEAEFLKDKKAQDKVIADKLDKSQETTGSLNKTIREMFGKSPSKADITEKTSEGYWKADNVVYAMQGKRQAPVAKELVATLSGVVADIDPELKIHITSGGQHKDGPRTGSHRHDVDEATGEGGSADIVLVKNGKKIRYDSDPELYTKVAGDLAAAGVTGIGHYPWGIHVGGGKRAVWGPDLTAATVDPEFARSVRKGWSTGQSSASVQAYLRQANAGLARNASRADLDTAAREVAGRISPNNVDLPDATSQRIEQRKGRELQMQRDQLFTDTNKVSEVLLASRGDNGKLPTSLDEILVDDDVKAAWERTPKSFQKKVTEELSRNSKSEYAATPENQAQFHELYGAMTNPQTTDDERVKLMEIPVATLEMPLEQRKQLLSVQNAMWKRAVIDPNIDRAMAVVKAQINGLIKPSNPKDYNRFRGIFAEAIKAEMEVQKRPLKSEELQQIARNIIQDVVTPGTYFGGYWPDKTKLYRIPVTPEVKNRIMKSFQAQGVPNPTDDQIADTYHMILYEQLYGKGQKTPNQPKIPTIPSAVTPPTGGQ